LSFYVTVAQEIIYRLPINSILFSEFEFITPSVALEAHKNDILINLANVCNIYESFVDVNSVKYEWRNLPFHFTQDEKEKLIQLPAIEFWYKLQKVQDFFGKYLFKNIAKIALIVLTLPYSNAEAERVFLVVTDIKTKKRNKIGNNSVNSVCIIRSKFNTEQKCTVVEGLMRAKRC